MGRNLGREPDKHIGKRIDGNAGWGRALSGFSRQLSPEITIERPLPPKFSSTSWALCWRYRWDRKLPALVPNGITTRCANESMT